MMDKVMWRQVSELVADNPKQFVFDLSYMLEIQGTVEQLTDTDWLTDGEASAILDAARNDYRKKWGFEPWEKV